MLDVERVLLRLVGANGKTKGKARGRTKIERRLGQKLMDGAARKATAEHGIDRGHARSDMHAGTCRFALEAGCLKGSNRLLQ